jgi:hypothetical protein
MNVSQKADIPEERPTTRTLDVPSAMLLFAARVERLCDLALERLKVGPDEDAIAAALGDIAEIRALAARVCR